VNNRSAELEGQIDSRIRMAGTAVKAYTAGAGIAVVAVLASVGQSMLVDHLGCDRITQQLVKACLASRLAFLLISTDLSSSTGTNVAWYASPLHSAVAFHRRRTPAHIAHGHMGTA